MGPRPSICSVMASGKTSQGRWWTLLTQDCLIKLVVMDLAGPEEEIDISPSTIPQPLHCRGHYSLG